jgi:ferric-dicitrate binding protein FerR (iron transport regulator)
MSDSNKDKPKSFNLDQIPFDQLGFSYKKSSADVWAEMQIKTNKSPATSPVRKLNQVYYWLSAAVLLIGFSSLGFFAFKTTEVQTLAGERQTLTMPDQSTVELNAGSRLTYYPYRWFFQRKLSLEGEAYFEVEKGSRFEVVSSMGTTAVLGTSFNIYTRQNQYVVYCTSGRVEVTVEQHQIILQPKTMAQRKGNELIRTEVQEQNLQLLSWRLGKFIYNTTPLQKVIMDMELEYNIQIELDSIISEKNFLYTGLFSRNMKASDAIEIVCSSFGLNYFTSTEGHFNIY